MLAHDVAYAAGFFDGEGSIVIEWLARKESYRGYRGYQDRLSVSVAQTTPNPLHWLSDQWGGSVRGPYLKVGNRKPYWRWALSSARAVDFLRAIYPWLQVKQGAAWLALEYWQQCPRQGGGRKPLSEEQFFLRLGYRLALQWHNRRGTP